MNKFEEIKQGLEEYDQAIKELHALPYAVAIDAPQQEFDRRDEIRNHFWHTKDKVDAQVEHWLRTLLPVVEVAVEYYSKEYEGHRFDWPNREEVEARNKIRDAVRTLQQSGGNS